MMTFWFNARIFSTHPYFLAINIGQRDCLRMYDTIRELSAGLSLHAWARGGL
jgi:hypothetical protein